MGAKPTVWQEVIALRKELHAMTVSASPELGGARSMQQWAPGEHGLWLNTITSSVERLIWSLGGPRAEALDPRHELIALMAVCSAWVDAMDQRTEIG